MFDRECPPSVDVSGRGLVHGLTELWARYLFETVRPDGSEGFSRFRLWWGRGQVLVEGDLHGAARVRAWVFGGKSRADTGYVAAADARLLRKIALAHAHLVLAGRSSEEILMAAIVSRSRRQFEAHLADLAVLDR
jgi:hypothetical protein